MLAFTTIDRANASKRSVIERVKDFKEVYNLFDNTKAKEQADRCINCGDPYCHNKCPLHNIIPAWLKQVSEDNLELAFDISNETSPFPEILGRICPQDKLCEGDCSLNETHGAIAIGSIEVYISETGFAKGLKPKFSDKKTGKKVAIIGSGPAGLSCATFLLRNGINVDIYERANKAGGLLTYGIPGFKLDKSRVERRVKFLEQAGANFILNCEIGKNKPIKELVDKYDAIFIGIGATKGRKAGIEGEDKPNVHLSMEFLTKVQKKLFNEEVENYIDVKNKNVVVIGGGDTAMDCVRTAIREGAKSVKCLYRRDEKNMPGSKKEVVNAKEEGVEFVFNVSPKKIVDNGIVLEKTTLTKADENGRKKVEIVPNSEYVQNADVIILALGFEQEKPVFVNELNLELDKYNGIKVNKNYQTSNKKVFAGGDSVRGANLAVTATYDGREAAFGIVKFLEV
jgi:glutamate synthase (NADPH/NADH) small chain